MAKFIRALGSVLFIQIEVNNESVSMQLSEFKASEAELFFARKQNVAGGSLGKWKRRMAVLSITGNQVVTKQISLNEILVKKIMENQELLWATFNEAPNGGNIAFVRKETIKHILDELNKNHIYIVKTYIGIENFTEIKCLLQKYWLTEMRFRAIKQNPVLLNATLEALFYKLRLPFLVVIFVLLLGNFFINNHLRQENEVTRVQLNLMNKEKEVNNKVQKDLNRLQTIYEKTSGVSFALIADRIASYVPSNLQLNSLIICPNTTQSYVSGKTKNGLEIKENLIIITGNVETPGSVSLFSELLAEDKLFQKVEIVSLNKQKKSYFFDFELHIIISNEGV